MLQINQEKMSKSLGNFTLAKDVLTKYPAPVIRLLMLQTHYRSPLDFSDARLDEASRAYERLTTPVRDAVSWTASADEPAAATDVERLRDAVAAAREGFDREMDDDFNTAGALGVVFGLVPVLNDFIQRWGVGPSLEHAADIGGAADTIVELLGVLGIDLVVEDGGEYPHEVVELAAKMASFGGDTVEDAVAVLLAARTEARAAEDWDRADAIRDGLAALGITVEDTPQGPRAVVRG